MRGDNIKYVIITLVEGNATTTVRVVFLEILGKIRQVHVDMIKAIGTLYHGSYYHALLRGFTAHYVFGIVSACIYLLLLGVFQPFTVYTSVMYGGL